MEYVYFFRETGRPYVKIGMSKNEVQTRFQSFKTYAPLGAYIVGYIKTSNAFLLEKELHKKYKDKRLQGEFFNLTDDEVYAEINIHDSKFGEVVSFVDYLVNDLKFDIDYLKSILKNQIVGLNENLESDNDVLLNFIKNNKGSFFTNKEIQSYLAQNGFLITQYKLGVLLSKLSVTKKAKRVKGLCRYGYEF